MFSSRMGTMHDHSPTLPDDQDEAPNGTVQSAPSTLFVVEGMAFAAALLGAGLLFQAVVG